ncbi:hypothetical protein E1176_00465, partial [Fulvivirga sp. RKSG066]|nr:hypothetical protein [Fulvivirga aurantia]
MLKPTKLQAISITVLLFVFLTFTSTNAQRAVGIGTTKPNQNAVLHLVSPGENQGFLLPQLSTAQRENINCVSPADDGLVVFDDTIGKFFFWNNGRWNEGLGSVTSVNASFNTTTNTLEFEGGVSVDLSALANTDSQT